MLNMGSTVRIYARTVERILCLIHFLVGTQNIKNGEIIFIKTFQIVVFDNNLIFIKMFKVGFYDYTVYINRLRLHDYDDTIFLII